MGVPTRITNTTIVRSCIKSMLYEYRCSACNHITTANRPMEKRRDPIECEECGGETSLRITGGQGFEAVLGAADFPGYHCPVTDTYVDSRKKRKEIMAEHGLKPHSSADQVQHHTGF